MRRRQAFTHCFWLLEKIQGFYLPRFIGEVFFYLARLCLNCFDGVEQLGLRIKAEKGIKEFRYWLICVGKQGSN